MAASRAFIVLLVIGLLVASTSFFTVDERQLAIKFQLGRIVESEFDPGLHFMKPLFINNVRTFDKRILTLDTRPERFLTGEKKNVSVDFFAKWRIADPATYYTAFAGDERQAALRLLQIIKNGMQLEFGKRTIQQVVSEDRTDMMEDLMVKANKQVNQFGINIVDVRVKQIELPKEVQTAVFERMQAERARIAAEHRAEGAENAKGIRAIAERERTVILAEANRDADVLRGKGDAAATEIYGNAYGKNQEFYEFYRSMNAYREALSDKQDMLILQPDSEFFKYFNTDAAE